MATANTQQKLPNTDIKVTYPFCSVTQTLGGHEVIYNNTKDEELVRHAHTKGSFKEWGKDGSERKLVANTKHSVVSQGASESIEGPHDHYAMNSSRQTNMGDHHSEVANNVTTAMGGSYVKIAKGDGHIVFNDGKSMIASGDDITHYFGDDDDTVNHHAFHSGDHTSFTKGNRYEHVEGEKGTYLPSGNMDIQLDNGKLRIKSSGDQTLSTDAKLNITADEVTITGQTKVTIKVGSNKIEITSSGITIDAGGGKVDVNAQGAITTQGQTTKIQGGGLTAPPTTFK